MDSDLLMAPAFRYADFMERIADEIDDGAVFSLFISIQIPFQLLSIVFTMCVWAPAVILLHSAYGIIKLPLFIYRRLKHAR
jgi:hypothetical protein